MNPMTNVKNIQKLNEKVLQMGVEDDTSWHKQYKDSAYVFIGGLPYDLTEGDILCVFSQYGEIVDINLVRDKSSWKSKGFGFLCYEDQRSTILAVDNLNSIKLGGRTIRVDHVANYKRPKGDERDEHGERKELPLVGCAPTTPSGSDEEEPEEENIVLETKKKKRKKEKSKKRAKENKKNKKDQVEERKRRISPASVESKQLKIAKVEKEFDDRMNKFENTSDMDRDRKRYNDDRGERMKLDKYRRPEHKDRDRGPVLDDDKYRRNIDDKNREFIKHNERDRGQVRDTDKKQYEDKNRK